MKRRTMFGIGFGLLAGLAAALSMTVLAQNAGPLLEFTGTWEVVGQPYEPWIFNLHAEGNRLTGTVWQEGGLAGPAAIVDGKVDGVNVTFSYRGFPRATRAAQFFPNLSPPAGGQNPNALTGTLRFTLTGVLRDNTIQFSSRIDDPDGVGIQTQPFAVNAAARGEIRGVPPGVAREMGLFGSLIPGTFSARRATPAVAGRIVIEETGIPRPVFQLAFVNADGRRFDPVRRDVWNQPAPRAAIETVNRPLGSAFDAVARFETNTLPGNPSHFVVRLPAGEYRPVVTGLPTGYTVKSIRSGVRDLTAATLEIADGRIPADVTIALGAPAGPPWGRVAGKVINAATRSGARGGNAGARGGNLGGIDVMPVSAVILASPSYSEFWMAPVQPDGSYEFRRILPGSYELRAFPDTVVTPAMNLTVPSEANLDLPITAPSVVAVPCPAC